MNDDKAAAPAGGWNRFFAVALILLTVAVYIPAIQSGFIWDDDDYILDNQTLTEAGGFAKIWSDPSASPQYYPLTLTSFWLERRLWGLRPSGYHLVNVLLHAANALLLWRVLARLAVPGGWLAAAMFALHPIEVESVAWITERKNVLSGFMYLLALLSWLRFEGFAPGAAAGQTAPALRRARRYYLGALLFFALALFSKTVAASLPAAILLILWWKRGLSRRDLLLVSPMIGLGVAAGALTSWLEKVHVGAVGADWAFSHAERLLIAGRALWFYAGKLLWPWPLVFIYPRWKIDAGSLLQALFPIAAAAVILALWLFRKRLGKGPAAAVLFFAGTLFPALGFFDIYPTRFSFVADHFQYLAGAGLIVLFGALAARVLEAVHPKRRLAAQAAVALAVLLPLGALTWLQGSVYRNVETLWRTTLARNPEAWIAHLNLGGVLRARGDLQGAIARFAETVRLKPDFDMGWYNWGTALAAVQDYTGAEQKLRKSLLLRSDYADAWGNLGIVLHSQGKTFEALAALSRARELKPKGHVILYNLGVIHEQQGRSREAVELFRRALDAKPDFQPARDKLGDSAARYP